MKKHIITAALLLSAAAGSYAQVAVVVGASATPPAKDHLADLYLGKAFDFKPLDLPEGSPLRDQFYRKATERDAAQVKATWSRIVFSGKGQAPKELPDSAAVKKAVAADPKAVGYIEKSAVDGSVKVIATFE
jgi:hypothetical protein